MMRIILLLTICVALMNAKCPNPTTLIMEHSENRFLCARLFPLGNRWASTSCKGSPINVYNGEKTHSAGNYNWNDKTSSLVVSVGCRLDVYEDGQYGGDHRQFTGMVPYLSDWDNKISSWSCSCDYSNTALTCTPSDEYCEISTCGNHSPGSTTCTHSIPQGLSIGSSVTQGNTLPDFVEFYLGVLFKEIFSVGLPTSTTTGYSWNTTDSSTFSEVSTTSISCEVPSGHAVKIVQVVGRCGDAVVYTSQYKCE